MCVCVSPRIGGPPLAALRDSGPAEQAAAAARGVVLSQYRAQPAAAKQPRPQSVRLGCSRRSCAMGRASHGKRGRPPQLGEITESVALPPLQGTTPSKRSAANLDAGSSNRDAQPTATQCPGLSGDLPPQPNKHGGTASVWHRCEVDNSLSIPTACARMHVCAFACTCMNAWMDA